MFFQNKTRKCSERYSSMSSNHEEKKRKSRDYTALSHHKNTKGSSGIWLNLVSDDTIMIKSQVGNYSEQLNSPTKTSQVVKDIGDIHEFYQSRVVTDYKNENEQLK